MSQDLEKLDDVLTPEEAYRQHYRFLVNLAIRKFGVPLSDAETLAHEVFVNFLASPTEIGHAKSYLVIGICRASKDYWRRENRNVSDAFLEARVDPTSAEISASFVRQMTGQEILRGLHDRCRRTLRMYYVDGYTAREIAELQATTQRYVEKLIGKCLKRAHALYRRIGGLIDGPLVR